MENDQQILTDFIVGVIIINITVHMKSVSGENKKHT